MSYIYIFKLPLLRGNKMLGQLTSGDKRLPHLNRFYRSLPCMISVGVEDKLERTIRDQLYREGPGFRAPELPHSVRDSVGKKI